MKFGLKLIPIISLMLLALIVSGCTGTQYVSPGDSNGYNQRYVNNQPVATPIPQVMVTGSNLNIAYMGSTNGYFGPTTQALTSQIQLDAGQKYTDTITISSSALLYTHSIDSFSISTPGFSIVSVQPNLPIKLSAGSSASVTLTIQTPNYAYTGPVTIVLSTT